MHGVFPSRKTSHPLPYGTRSSRLSAHRRRQLQLGAIIGCAALFLILIIPRLFGSSSERIPLGTPEVVIVTLIDEEDMSKEYIEKVQENRRYYASRHGKTTSFADLGPRPRLARTVLMKRLSVGYTTFFPNVSDYSFGDYPRSWALVPALRHALTVHPHSTYFFALSPHALIMNPAINLKSHVLEKKKLESIMLTDRPVVPPDSVIKTFGNLKGDRVDLVLTQDGEGLCQGSFILKGGEWAKFLLDTWFDPLYRSYNFQKAEGHALEHIVQWHPTILTKLALVPQRLLNSYNVDIASRGGKDVMYKDGDFVVRLVACELYQNRDCEKEFELYYIKWKRSIGNP
ncbi:MAG: hypothetical protein Q9211_004318 [Gyalolechia sp. 1 TL-2023]